MENTRSEFIALRVTPKEKEQLKAIANQNGFSLSTLTRYVLLKII